MGLERTAAVLQGVGSNFEIDTLRPLCVAAGEAVGVKYAFEGEQGRPLRRIADHIRAVAMCIHEGVVPDNVKQGYIVRLLLRRAMLEGYLLGKQEPFLYTLVDPVFQVMKTPYPDVAGSMEAVSTTVREEEQSFLAIIERGLAKFDRIVQHSRTSGNARISGEDAFEWHTQDGFLIEMTEAMAARHNLAVDTGRFRQLLDEHREKSGGGVFIDAVMAEGPLDAIRKTAGNTRFLGYEATEADAKVVGIIAEKQLVESVEEIGEGHPIAVLLDQTPFYGEAGGQVGDVGTITRDGMLFEVRDTQRDGELLLHIGHLRRGTLSVGHEVHAAIDAGRRAGIRRAHSATHILHYALEQTLGSHAMQRGSKVENDVLRFDFSHTGPLTPEERLQVEDLINARIAEGAPVATAVVDQKQAKQRGAKMLFGEKYPDRVRMVSMGEFSVELCGGTHLSNTGQVGLCRLVAEEPIARGVRRIVAYTGHKARESVREAESLLAEVARALKVSQPQELPRRAQQLHEEVQTLKRELARHTKASIGETAADFLAEAEDVRGAKIVCRRVEVADRDALREYADELRRRAAAAVLLAAELDGKVALLAAVSKGLVKQGIKAGDCVREAAKAVGGGGGGRPDLAEAGGKDASKIDEALAAGADVYRRALSALSVER
jgi:alanyl-tRNA synthetase